MSESSYDKHTDINAGHGRIEARTYHQLLVDKSWLDKTYRWGRFKSIIKIKAQVHDKSTGKDTEEVRWFISSLDLNAEQALNALRSYWQVELVSIITISSQPSAPAITATTAKKRTSDKVCSTFHFCLGTLIIDM